MSDIRVVQMKRAAVDQGVSRLCEDLKSIGDTLKMNYRLMASVKCIEAKDHDSEKLVDEVIVMLKELMKSWSEDCDKMDKDHGALYFLCNVFPLVKSRKTASVSSLRLPAADSKPQTLLKQPPPQPLAPPQLVTPGIPENIPPPASVLPPKMPPQLSRDIAARETLPPPPMPLCVPSKGPVPPPPRLPMPLATGGAPPIPPPPGLTRTLFSKKPQTKLKRSTQISKLYQLLKAKMEGANVNSRSNKGIKVGRVGNSCAGGKQGMSDTIAEMAKRSPYYQQIEKDVQQYGRSIMELKVKINSFRNTDMIELLKFRNQVESCLEKLTDETQVLNRFEGFPGKKLESLRTAAALYSKLETIIADLQSWKIAPPLNRLLDQIDRYFAKMKQEVEAIERMKDEEEKKFQVHNLHFDQNVFVRVKESMVDLSSSCIELALKGSREFKTKEDEQRKEYAKMLWRVFQLAFKAYSFAGGQDDHAENLTRELAREIETWS